MARKGRAGELAWIVVGKEREMIVGQDLDWQEMRDLRPGWRDRDYKPSVGTQQDEFKF
jgi:hypothetical protein